MNEELLRRAAQVARPPRLPRAVPPRDVALLAAELGRPLPAALATLWSAYGAGFLGRVSLWDPRAIAQGLATSERFLDEGLLPFAHGGDGALWLLALADVDDPVVEAHDPPRRERVGSLSNAVEMAALVVLIESGAPDRAELEERLAEMGPQNPRPKVSM